MTEVEFHVNVPDRLQYACRLLRKASRKGVRVAVTGSPATLSELDRHLWNFEAEEFLPHVRVASAGVEGSGQRRSPVWLVGEASLGLARSQKREEWPSWLQIRASLRSCDTPAIQSCTPKSNRFGPQPPRLREFEGRFNRYFSRSPAIRTCQH